MSSSSLIRLAGLAALAGGVLIVITGVVGLVALDYEKFRRNRPNGRLRCHRFAVPARRYIGIDEGYFVAVTGIT